MKVKNISGNANQLHIETFEGGNEETYFVSYEKIIVKIVTIGKLTTFTYLDSEYWDYSNTTGKYRNIFLNETKKETEAKIAEGKYILTNLNKY